MKLEDFDKAKEILQKIDETDSQLTRIDNILASEKGSKIIVGIKGQIIELPKAVVVGKLNSKKQELETEKADLENEFKVL